VKLQQLCQVHATTKDFSTSFVLKDRFGSGGNLVFLINTSDTQSILEILRAYPHKSFILQPLLHFDKGFTHKGKTSTTDIRLLFFNGKLVQSYIRTAPESDFRCNAHQGGSCVYLSKSEIPNEVLKKSQLIVEFIPPGTFYALDFVVSNNQNVYFLEGNMGPGIYWNTDSKIEERKTKELIGYICRDLVTRVNSDNDSIATERPDSDSLMKSAYYY
jgi:glutathione synthase/RimK-type ligase-like ATP-grasp enzyme